VDSFTILTLRYGDTVKRISTQRSAKINRVISRQITDKEKAIIATLDTKCSALAINAGKYKFTDFVKLLAQNVTSFTKKYVPSGHLRITTYLRARARKFKNVFELATQGTTKGKGPPAKRQKVSGKGHRAWTYLEETTPMGLKAPAPYSSKGKSKGKGRGKGKSKGKGKLSCTSHGKGKGKGKAKGKFKGKESTKGKASPLGLTPGNASGNSYSNVIPSASLIKCHFCHVVGHIKPNCRKWLALSQDERYKQRNTHPAKYQLIYDHLEDSILAPRFCPYCSDANCDGQNCESPFDYDDYDAASVFFTQSLGHLVVNAKLDRPLDSHTPQTEHMYHYDDDDWGEQHEYESESQWDRQDDDYHNEQEYEAYPTEMHDQHQDYDLQDQDEGGDQDQDQDDEMEEDDQDTYE
jgi:hypothetical protein